MDNELTMYGNFKARLDSKTRRTAEGIEFWMARDIQEILNYTRWEKFRDLLDKARMACINSGMDAARHFHPTVKMISTGMGAQREREDWYLTRYACYLAAMNGESSKPEIGFAQTYFAVQARRQELADEAANDEKRLEQRDRIKVANRELNSAAKRAGVEKFGVFHDEGYRGLYRAGYQAIKRRKGIPPNEHLLDRAGRAELAANEFRITLTEQKIVNEQIRGEGKATQAHRAVGRDVRDTIERSGGTTPEHLPPERHIRELTARKRKRLRLPKPRPAIE